MDRFILGSSASVEAEYGLRADAAVTLLHLYEGEPVTWEGFVSIEAAKAALKADGSVPASQIEWLCALTTGGAHP